MVSWFIQESGDHSIFVSSSERSPIIYFANINQLRSQLFAVKQSIENSLKELDANLDAQKISFKAVAETLTRTSRKSQKTNYKLQIKVFVICYLIFVISNFAKKWQKITCQRLNNTTNNLSVIRDYINEAVQAAGQESQSFSIS